jgi:tRNA G18 (ribose-2'-O)-methylase SpoU
MIRQLSKAELRETRMDRKAFVAAPRLPVCVVLHNVISGANIGAVFRLADCILAEKIYLCGASKLPTGVKMQKVSRKAERWAPWEYCDSTVKTVEGLKARGYRIMAAELCAQSVDYLAADYAVPGALILGGESDGLPPEVLALADSVVALPVRGMVNSLNVGTVAAVLLFKFQEHAARLANPRT